MNYQTLSTLLADAAYTSLSAADAATALNTASVSLADNTLYTWRAIARVTSLATAVALKTAMEASVATKPEYQLALDMLGQYADGGGVSFADPQVVAIVSEFLAAGTITAAQAAALAGLGITKVSPADNAGLGMVTDEDVVLARAAKTLATDTAVEYPQDELRKAFYADLTDQQVVTLWNSDWPGLGASLFGRPVDLADIAHARQQIGGES